MSQAKRKTVMKAFRDAKLQILVASDIAARGLDIEGVTHAIRILELFAIKQKQYLTLGEISLSLQIHKTTVYRILRTLQKVGWIKQNENGGHYCLGSGALLVTANAISHYTRQTLFEEEMRNLANQFNELVILATLHE